MFRLFFYPNSKTSLQARILDLIKSPMLQEDTRYNVFALALLPKIACPKPLFFTGAGTGVRENGEYKTSDLSCVRWLVLMYHADGNAANTGGLNKTKKKRGVGEEGGGGEWVSESGTFTPIFKDDRSYPVFQNWSGTNICALVIALFFSLSLHRLLFLSSRLTHRRLEKKWPLFAIPSALCMLISPVLLSSAMATHSKTVRIWWSHRQHFVAESYRVRLIYFERFGNRIPQRLEFTRDDRTLLTSNLDF